MSGTTRRDFLIGGASLGAASFLLPTFSSDLIAGGVALDQFQGDWRYCEKCHVIFYNGFQGYGRCQSGGGHSPQGYQFFLPYGTNLPELPTAQLYWRYCQKCFAMFFDHAPTKGRCPAGGGHQSQGLTFRLPHDVKTDNEHQSGWRFCQKCLVMFYDGNGSKGSCAAGGGHEAQGFNFVLPHALAPDIHFHADVTTPDSMPISGFIDVTMRQNGDFDFATHIHDSGADNIQYTLGVIVAAASGQCFGFGVDKHTVDGTRTIINRRRDDNAAKSGNDGRIKADWPHVLQGSLHWQLHATSTLGTDIGHFMENLAKEGFRQLALKLKPTLPGQNGQNLQNVRAYLSLLATL